jgi:ABC-type transport system involved in multi-copper enzyme maturation permease subunit
MRPIWIIARTTFREIMRDRILYGIVVFALLLIGLSLALGELSFAEQARISANFGFAGIHLGACILAVFVGSSLVAKEIEKQTILTLLARPITRTQFLVGKFTGLVFVLLIVVMGGLGAVLAAIISTLDMAVDINFFTALFGVLLESLILLSLALFFGTFARPIMTVIFTGALFLIGHWAGSLRYFVEKSQSQGFKVVGTAIATVVPDLERFNWRSAPVYQTTVPTVELLHASLYALGWIAVLITATSLVFRRRDFV